MQLNPSTWRKRNDISIKIGTSMGERMRKAQALVMHLQNQLMMQEKGSTLVTNSGIYATLNDLAYMQELSFPDRYYVDPVSQQGKQLQQEKQKSIQQQTQIQQKQQQDMLDLQREIVAMQEQTKKLVQQNKDSIEMRKQMGEMMRFNKELMAKLTELELKYGQQVPGSSV